MLLKLLLLFLQVFINLQAQEVVLEGPEPPVAANTNVTYTCTAQNGTILWSINGFQLSTEMRVNNSAASGIVTPLPQSGISTVTIDSRRNNERIVLQCEVRGPAFLGIIARSRIINFTTYGAPFPPLNLMVAVNISLRGFLLSWTPGFTFMSENVTYVVNVTTSMMSVLESGIITPFTFIATPSSGRLCSQYSFTVHAENDVSLSNESLQTQQVAPTVLAALDSDDIMSSVVLGNDVACFNLSFMDLSPCLEYGVLEYSVMLVEVTNSFNITVSAPLHISAASFVMDGSGLVTVIIGSSYGLLRGRLYMLELAATSTVSSSRTNFTIYTTGLQGVSAMVDITLATITMTCTFAEGSLALGCQAMLTDSVPLLRINVSHGDAVAMGTAALPQGYLLEELVVVEVLGNGELSAIRVRPTIDSVLSPTTAQPSLSSTVRIPGENAMTSSLQTNSQPTSRAELFLQGSILYAVIGVIAAVILVLILIIIVVIIIIRTNRKKKRTPVLNLNNGEELKANYVYGGTDASPHICTTSEFTGLESGKQARCNTYDTADLVGASNGKSSAPIPTYATVESARKETFLAGGPAILNPVYGPGSSLSPAASPTPVPVVNSKQVPNPIYSEAYASAGKSTPREDMKHIPIVSGLNPVYGVGSVASSLNSQANLSPRYTNNSGVSKSFGNTVLHPPSSAGSGSSPTIPPLYEELKPVTLQAAPSQRPQNFSLTNNDSYISLNAEPVKSPPNF